MNRHLEGVLSVGLVASLITLGSAMIASLVALMVIPMMLLKAWVLTYLWAWFVMPMFDLPQLTLVHAMGFVLLVNFLRSAGSNMSNYKDRKKKEEQRSEQTPEEKKLEQEEAVGAFGGWVLGSILGPLVVLLVGYILHLFM